MYVIDSNVGHTRLKQGRQNQVVDTITLLVFGMAPWFPS